MEKEKTVDLLNSLIVINNDRIEGYKDASEESEEHELNNLFSKFISTSQKCKKGLIDEVNKLGGEIAEGTKTSGKFFRAWMDVKAAITGQDRKAILISCENGEDKAQEAYEDALKDDLEHLTPEQQTMIRDQKSKLDADRKEIISMHNALKED